MIPSKFQDINIRIFTRDSTKMQAIQKAFRKYLSYITHTDLHSDPVVSVPDDYQDLLHASHKRARTSTENSH